MNPRKLITHNGSFHADDIFAAATLSLYLESRGEPYEIIRTRDPKIIEGGDFVFDVGGIYNADNNRFDHHQAGGAGKREDGIEYASFGLVWKKFGAELSGGIKEMGIIEKKLVEPVDAFDNGIPLVKPIGEIYVYTIQRVFESIMKPTWLEDLELTDSFFKKAVDFAKDILLREIKHAQGSIKAEAVILDEYKNTKDKRILILNQNCPIGEVVRSLPELLYAVYPRRHDGLWTVTTISDQGSKTFITRKDLPSAWGGLRDEALQNITGVSDAVFCHKGLFMAVAKSKEGAVKLAELALKN